ncbi:MAG: hypothetical protein HKN22_06980, partial [Bacteroidia bacterium]|nr:hypothetical protein [Bacteroidia bacterium]
IVGTANASYHFNIRSCVFQDISASVDISHFDYQNFSRMQSDKTMFTGLGNYYRLSPSLQFVFRNKEFRSTIAKTVDISSSETYFDQSKRDPNGFYDLEKEYEGFYNLAFTVEDKRRVDPFKVKVGAEYHEDFTKVFLDAKYLFSFKEPGEGVLLRFFAGKFIVNNSTSPVYNFRMDGGPGTIGVNYDYQFEHLYLGRTERDGILFQQFYVRDGGFKIQSPVGQSNDWLAAMNVMVDLPGPLPIKLYCDFGTYSNAAKISSLDNKVLISGGLMLNIAKDVVEVYFPLFESSDIENYLETNQVEFLEQVRFVLNLKALSPFKIREIR